MPGALLRTIRRRRLLLLLAAGVLAVAAWYLQYGPMRSRRAATGAGPADHRRVLASALAVDLPEGVRNVECRSYGFTDVQTECAFEMHPENWDRILGGRRYARVGCPGEDSHDATGGPDVGPRFTVGACYRASPPE